MTLNKQALGWVKDCGADAVTHRQERAAEGHDAVALLRMPVTAHLRRPIPA